MPLGGLDHPFRLGKADGHRLFENDVLTTLGSQDHMRAVARVGRGDPDGIDIRIVAQRLDGGVGFRSVLLFEHLESSWVDVGSGDEVDMRHRHHGWHDARRRQAQTYHPNVQGARWCLHVSSPDYS